MPKEISSRLQYPNPFTPVGIEFEIPAVCLVTVKILDQTGQEVRSLVENKQFESGKHLIPFDLSNYSNGTYLYQLSLEIAGKIVVETKNIL